MKKLLILTFLLSFSLYIYGCNKESKNEDNITNEIIVENNIEIEKEKNKKIETTNENKVIITSDGENIEDLGSESYYFDLNKDTKELTYEIHHSSIFPNDYEEVIRKGKIKIEDEDIFNKIVEVYEKNVLNSEWEVVYIGQLEDIKEIIYNNIYKTKEEIGEEYWNDLYGKDDLNGDGIVTYRERFDCIFEDMLEDL